MENNKYHYQIEKVIFNSETTNKIFRMFGMERGRSIRDVYIAIKILHSRYANRDYDNFFYCTVTDISNIAMITRKYVGTYVWALQKLGLIYRVINPRADIINNDESLQELVTKFEYRVNKKTSFIKVFMPSEKVIRVAKERAIEVNKWLKDFYRPELSTKKAKSLIKKLELSMSKEEINDIRPLKTIRS